jgi:hypothetical protein
MAWGEVGERFTEIGGAVEHPAVIAAIAKTNSTTLLEHALDIGFPFN